MPSPADGGEQLGLDLMRGHQPLSVPGTMVDLGDGRCRADLRAEMKGNHSPQRSAAEVTGQIGINSGSVDPIKSDMTRGA